MTSTDFAPGVEAVIATDGLTGADLLRELAPHAERNLARHLSLAEEWMPHEYVPWSVGRDFGDLPWEPGQSALSEICQIALDVNLLTEDNLPSYHYEIAHAFGRDSVWGTWVHRWTAEEGRHSIVMRDYLLVTRSIDPVALERGRMHQMQVGYNSGAKTHLQALAYVSFQELATRISHRNTGRMSGDPALEKLLARVAADENLHMIFYRDLVAAALELTPSATVQAIRDEVIGFEMPGTGIQDFQAKAKKIAKAGIYDLRIHHDEVLQPLLRKWGFFDISGLDADGERARDEVRDFLAGLDALATRHEQRAAKTG